MPDYQDYQARAKEQLKKLYKDKKNIDIDVSDLSNFGIIANLAAYAGTLNQDEIDIIYSKLDYNRTSDPDFLFKTFGHIRKQPTYSTKVLTVNANSNFTVPSGTLIVAAKDDGLTYRNRDDFVTDSEGFYEGKFICDVIGSIGNKASELVVNVAGSPSSFQGDITDPFSSNDGQEQETNLEYTRRWEYSPVVDLSWNRDGLAKRLLELNGVSDTYPYENKGPADEIIGDRTNPPHYREVMVSGGFPEDIQETIYNSTDRAIGEGGNVVGEVIDFRGEAQPVEYSTPTDEVIEHTIINYQSAAGGPSYQLVDDAIKDYINQVFIAGIVSNNNCIRYVNNRYPTGIVNLEVEFNRVAEPQVSFIQLLYYEKSIST
jgi:hypothetical protein